MATAAEMVTALKTALESNAGVVTLRQGDRQVTYDRDQALRELSLWEERAAAADSTTGQLKICKLNFKGMN